MATRKFLHSGALPDAEIDALLQSINQIDEIEMQKSTPQSHGRPMPAEGDIGGFYEWDFNDGCVDPHQQP